MDLIRVRSPYIILIDEPTQTQTKVELFTWNFGGTPTLLKTFIKNIVSPTQIETRTNISPYIKDYIQNVYPDFTYPVIGNDEITMWCYVGIVRYYRELPTDEWTEIDSFEKIATNGNTTYLQGVNAQITSDAILLYNQSQTIYYDVNSAIVPYVNFIIDGDVTGYYFRYFGIDTPATVTDIPVGSGLQLYKVPIFDDSYPNGNYLQLLDSADLIVNSIKVLPVSECKYTPVLCSYINRFGGWDFITFFKAKKESLQVKGSDYRLNPAQWNYYFEKGQEQNFNMNGTQTIKLNTGWVEEFTADKIQDLMLSETVLLDSTPAKLKTSSLEIKQKLKGRMINYELDFEWNYNLINDVV